MHIRTTEEKTLIGLEFATSLGALTGGLMLIVRPDGAILRAKLSALTGSPFGDWRVPGILLGMLGGGGFLLGGLLQTRGWVRAREVSIVCGIGLVGFEIAELAWIGFQPLEVLFVLVGLAVTSLAIRQKSQISHGPV